MDKHQHLEEIDRSLADIQVMGQVAIRAAQNLQLCEDDSGCYRLPEQETSILLFSVHDVLDRIEKLRAAKAGPDARTVDEADIHEGGINKNQTRQPNADVLYELRHMAILGIRVLEGMDEKFSPIPRRGIRGAGLLSTRHARTHRQAGAHRGAGLIRIPLSHDKARPSAGLFSWAPTTQVGTKGCDNSGSILKAISWTEMRIQAMTWAAGSLTVLGLLISACASHQSSSASPSGAPWARDLNERPPSREPADRGIVPEVKSDLKATRDRVPR
ncbi:hypothetical protein [Bradyrhizobium sp. USDA 327]|uniref:hypothetical protein n=1 Tax=Bradyrhizobium sp. USDA 327 TaxID=3156308 RepID=UPI00351811C9